MRNFDRFKDLFSEGDSVSAVNTAFAFYLEENYKAKERGNKSLATECCLFPIWLFNRVAKAVKESEVKE